MSTTRPRTDTEPADALTIRLATCRGLSLRDEERLERAISIQLRKRGFQWEGTQLAGAISAARELDLDDVVTLVHLFLLEPAVATVVLSYRKAGAPGAAAELKLVVRSGQAEALTLCDLHRRRLLDAEPVLRALGGDMRLVGVSAERRARS